MAGSALGDWLLHCVPPGFTFGQRYSTSAMSYSHSVAPLPSAPETPKSGIRRHDYVSVHLAARSSCISIMLVEGAIAIGARFIFVLRFSPGQDWPLLDMRCSQAPCWRSLTGDYLTGKLGRHLVCLGALWPRQGFLVFCSAMPLGVLDLRALEQVWPRLFPIRCRCRNIEAVHPVPASP